MSELAKRYAQALYTVAPDESELHSSAQCLMENAPLWESLCSPAIHTEEKKRVLERLAFLDGHEILLYFYQLLAEKGRMVLLPDILEKVRDIALGEQNAARCVMKCVRIPSEEEQARICAKLCQLHHKRTVTLDIQTDPALLGGFVLEIEGVTYDKSARGALEGMKRQMEERRMA